MLIAVGEIFSMRLPKGSYLKLFGEIRLAPDGERAR
jgi:hypothetical protein